MHPAAPPPEPRQSAYEPRHSSFAAAFFSLILPGLGQMYARRFLRGLVWMVPWLIAGALIAGIAFSMGVKDFAAQFSDLTWLQYLVIGIGVDLVWRLLSVLDAFWVARAPSGVRDATVRRVGSMVGLVAVITVLFVSHAAVARQTYSLIETIDCLDQDCGEDPGADESPDPDESIEPLPSLLPLETDPPASLDPDATPTVEPTDAPEPTPTVPWDISKGRLNILLVGTNGLLTDTMIVVSIDPDTNEVAFIGVPRDTVGLDMPRNTAASRNLGNVWGYRANQVYSLTKGRSDLFPGKTDRERGYGALKSILGQSLGIDIPYYVQVDMNGFMDVVNALGGAVVDVQLPLYDVRYNSNDGRGTLKLYVAPGYHYFGGGDALAYARSRHASSDFERSTRQMRVIAAVRNQLDIGSILQPGGIDKYLQIVKKNIKTDIPSRLFPQLAELAQRINLDDRISLQLAPYTTNCQTASVANSALCRRNGRYALVANTSKMRKAVQDVFKTDPKLIAKQQTLASEGAVVHVLNGTRAANTRSTRIAEYLEYLGMGAILAPVNGGRAEQDDFTDTVITVYNGGESQFPETIATLQQEFDVTAVTEDDPSQAANIVVTVGSGTPNKRVPN
ncbi:MAG: LCP family protein [Chloroflexi bacterium]|nr:LCP family protein [Chloroflexota bacterium]